ncbi:MAG: riboflavin kinase [Clostridia bacterium]|nr:riboflavin kinase [Clostridia bacterium]
MIIEGIVETGKRLGRTIGFPTANILADGNGDFPGKGVYAGALWLEGESAPWPCMVNLGIHPTAPEGKPTIEAYILNFSEDIYDRRVRLELSCFLREETRFEGLEKLRAQLESDRLQTEIWAKKVYEQYGFQSMDPEG